MSEDFTSTSDKQCHIGGYVLLSTIGKGSFAKVMLARHVVTGTEVAVKIVNRRGSSLGFREFHCLKSLHHPNITKLFEVIATEDHYFLFMEHMSGGQLFDYLENAGARTEEEARTLFRQLLSALHYCHQKGFVHRDLKPENILLDGDQNIKLADFGFSKEYSDKLSTFCGTVTYMAPEILRSQPYDGQKVDIWSLGVILYKMVTGTLPFVGHNFGEVKRQVLRGHFLIPYFLSEECQHLLKKMITLDPAQRPTLDAIIKDPWVNRDEKEEVKLYREPPWGDIDPQVTEKMKHLGFKQEEIRESVAQKKYNNIMGTYLILHSNTMKVKGHTVRVRPYSFPDHRRRLSPTPEPWAAGEKTNKSTSPPTNVAARVAVHTTPVDVKLTVPSVSPDAEVDMPNKNATMNLAIRSASPEVQLAVPANPVEVKLAVPSASPEVEVGIPNKNMTMNLAIRSASPEVQLAIPATPVEVKLAVLSASPEAEVAISTTTMAMYLAVPSASPEAQLAVPATPMEVKLALPSASPEAEVAIPTTTVAMNLAVPSASPEVEVAIPTTTVEMNLAVPSASQEVEGAITTTTVESRVHVSTTSGESKVGIQQTIKSGPPLPRTTCPLPCPESRAATPSPALQHGSWGSFTTPGSRKNSTRRTGSTRSTSSSTQSSASHHSKGQQQGTGRVLQFFLKVFCCWPSPSIHEERHKRAKVHPRFCLQFCRVKIGPH